MHQVTIPLRYLAAARLFAPKQDIRTYLKGVALKDGHVVATDGTFAGAIVCAQIPPGMPEIIIPSDAIDFYLKRAKGSSAKDVTIQWDEAGNGHLTNGAAVEAFRGVDGRYPDFRRILPAHTEPNGCAQFMWEKLVIFEKAAIALGTKKGAPLKAKLLPDGAEGAARVDLPGHPEFLGVVMPVREKKEAKENA